MKKPCNKCPFRKDTLKGWLGKRRASVISEACISDTTFHCHKTLDSEGEIGPKSQVCAGSVLLHVKEGMANRYYRYIQKDYEGAELVFDSVDELIEHHT